MDPEVEAILCSPTRLSKAQILQVVRATLGQRFNPTWVALHKRILTSTRFASAVTAKQTNARTEKFIASFTKEVYPTEAMKYGAGMEDSAKVAYEKQTGWQVQPTGLWLLPSGVAGASPDGLVYKHEDDVEPMGLVEIKCPYSMRDKSNNELVEFAEKTWHRHYWQVQGQMAATYLPWVHLYFWSPKGGGWCRRIERDEKYINGVIPEIEWWFVQRVLPHIVGVHDIWSYF